MSDFLTSTLPQTDLLQLCGVLGFGFYVVNYTLLSLRRIDGDSPAYFLINLLAAGLVLAGLMGDFNLAAALIQGFWICMSLMALALRLRRWRQGFAPGRA